MGFCVLKSLKHTGSVPPKVETQTPPFDTEADRDIEQQQHTGNTTQQEVDWDNYVFESRRRDVQGHDDEGGHTEERHIGKSERWLQKRAATLPRPHEASSFTDTASANLTQAKAVKEYRTEIEAYLASDRGKPMVLNVEMNREIGKVVNRSGKVWKTKKAKIVITKDNSSLGYKILTSYPVK